MPAANRVRLRRFLKSEAGATVVWTVAALLLAAVIAPWLYAGGKNLGALTAARDFPGVIEWLGAACARSNFQRYFSRSLMISAVVLLPFLWWQVRVVRRNSGGRQDSDHGPGWRAGAVQLLVGCGVAGGVLWATGMLLVALGAFDLKPQPLAWWALPGKVIGPAVGASLVEEWLFRGVLLGLWLRFTKPLAACVGTSLFFAFIHFLRLPEGAVITDPASTWTGFEFLGKILFQFVEPVFFVKDFAILFGVGMILCHGRLATGALWFPVGLHVGWIMAFKCFTLRHLPVVGSLLHPWAAGDTLRSGLVPLLALGLTAVICQVVLRRLQPQRVAC